MERAGFHGRGYSKFPNASSSASGSKLPPKLPPVPEISHPAAAAEENEWMVREQDRLMPIANVIRIMRQVLPPQAKISDDAKEIIQECVTEYIGFITSEANERCRSEQRKTISAEDVLWAMNRLGFDDYIEPLSRYLHRYREVEGDRGSSRGTDQKGKRTVEYATMGVPAPIAPTFEGHPTGYYVPAMESYMRDESDAGSSSHAAPTNDEQNE